MSCSGDTRVSRTIARRRSLRLSLRGLSEGHGRGRGEGGLLVVISEEELVRAALAAEEPAEVPHRAVVARELEADRALVEPQELLDLVVLAARDALHRGHRV